MNQRWTHVDLSWRSSDFITGPVLVFLDFHTSDFLNLSTSTTFVSHGLVRLKTSGAVIMTLSLSLCYELDKASSIKLNNESSDRAPPSLLKPVEVMHPNRIPPSLRLESKTERGSLFIQSLEDKQGNSLAMVGSDVGPNDRAENGVGCEHRKNIVADSRTWSCSAGPHVLLIEHHG